MKKNIKVGFLFDSSNNWISEYLDDSNWLSSLPQTFIYKKIYLEKESIGFDVLFILGYTRIIPKSILDKNHLNLLVHESPLPKGRGFSPVQWQILEGINKIPVNLIEATEFVDRGDIFNTAIINLEGHELLNDIREAQAEATKKLIAEFLIQYPRISMKPQEGDPTYYSRRKRQDDAIDANQTIASQFNKFRIINNEEYPAYFDYLGFRYKLTITKIDRDD